MISFNSSPFSRGSQFNRTLDKIEKFVQSPKFKNLKFARANFRGFTLLEVIIVMALIGLLAGLVVPRITGNQLTQLKAQVREAVAVLKYARRIAVVSGQPQKVSFYPSSEEGTPVEQNRPQRSKPGQWVSRGALLVWEGGNSGEREGEAYVFRFYPGGGSSGGEFFLEQDRFRALIKVHPMTGKVSVEFPEPRT